MRSSSFYSSVTTWQLLFARGAPKLLLVTTTLNISIVSEALLFLSKRSSAERWGVKSTIIAFYSDVWDPSLRSRMTNALLFFLLLSHCVTAPLSQRGAPKLLLVTTTLNISIVSKALLFLPKRATRTSVACDDWSFSFTKECPKGLVAERWGVKNSLQLNEKNKARLHRGAASQLLFWYKLIT